MNIYFSDFMDLDAALLDEYGAFDVSLINDLPLFVDPFLLFNSRNVKYQELHAEIIRYMMFLKNVSLEGPLSIPLLKAWFTFPEVKQNWLGFSREGNRGSGLGLDFAIALNKALNTMFRDFGEEKVSKGSHLEKLCLIRAGVGRDNISDFTTNLILGFLADYTQEFARANLPVRNKRRIALRKIAFNYSTRSWIHKEFELPYINNDFVLLTPKDILTKDEAWINRPDLLDMVPEIANALPDSVLRAQVNDYLRRVLPTGPKVTQKEIRAAQADTVNNFPQLLDYYIRIKEDDGDLATSLAKYRVTEAEKLFIDQVRKLVVDILAPSGFYKIGRDTYEEAKNRVVFLKDVIENKGGHRIFYIKEEPIEREADLQILYRLTWYATPSDVSREVNDGRGPADFKISRGAIDKTIVEFKLAKNTQLERNLIKQAEVYEKASDTTHKSIKVILYFTENEYVRVNAILDRLGLRGNPNIVLIDARADNKTSGSKA